MTFQFGAAKAGPGGCCGKPVGCNIESQGCIHKVEKRAWLAKVRGTTVEQPCSNPNHDDADHECPVAQPADPPPLVPIWTVCPNGTCHHGLIVHDGDGDGPYVCCEDGCDCGKSA